MKTGACGWVMLVLAGVTPDLRADWGRMQAGLTERAARAAVGAPLIASRSSSRVHAMWTYDAGGYVQFERGRVTHWVAPRVTVEPGVSATPGVARSAGPAGLTGPTAARLVRVR